MIPSADCGKVPYPNPVTAWRAIRALASKTALLKHKQLHKRCTAYLCEQCHHWHITRQNPDRSAAWRQRQIKLRESERQVRG